MRMPGVKKIIFDNHIGDGDSINIILRLLYSWCEIKQMDNYVYSNSILPRALGNTDRREIQDGRIESQK